MKFDVMKYLKRREVKAVLLIVAVVAAASLVLSTSLAYLSKSSGAVVNEFGIVELECEVKQTSANGSVSEIYVQIPETGTTGYADAYVRATVVCNWQDADGNVVAKFDIPALPAELGDDWVLGSDGYYYYTKALTGKDDRTTDLFTTAITCAGSTEDCKMVVTVIAEAIQADGSAPIDDYWQAVAGISNGVLTIE